MPAKNTHVVPSANGRTVQVEGGQDGDVQPTQDAAIAAGTVHEIRERNSFGHDPRNVKG